MFGYLKPHKEEMKIRDYELYKSIYCGLCRHLGRDYGVPARFTLSYDCTALAVLALAVHGSSCSVKKGRCTCNPLKKCMFCDCADETFVFIGAVSVILAYYKLYDTIMDSGIIKKTGAVLLKMILYRSYRKAKKAFPVIDEKVAFMISKQKKAEEDENTDIDTASEPTASLISEICSLLSEDEQEKLILRQFGYFTGRWIYIIDAADDLENDIADKNFNPFIKSYNGDILNTMLYCNEVLNLTVSEILLAYDLLELGVFKHVMDNIFYEGLTEQQKKCLFEKRKDVAKDENYFDHFTGSEL